MVTFGIVPTAPETGYGYIRAVTESQSMSEALPVLEFVEKPDRATAEGYLASGGYFWNSGIFLFSVRTLIDELFRHAPAILTACREATEGLRAISTFCVWIPNHSGPLLPIPLIMPLWRRPTGRLLFLWTQDGVMWAHGRALWDFHERDESGNVQRG